MLPLHEQIIDSVSRVMQTNSIRQHNVYSAIIIHYCHLLLLHQKALTLSRERVEGWAELGHSLHAKTVYLLTDSQSAVTVKPVLTRTDRHKLRSFCCTNFYQMQQWTTRSRDGTRSGFLTRDPTQPDGFWPSDPTRSNPVSSPNDVKSRNVLTSWRHKDNQHVSK